MRGLLVRKQKETPPFLSRCGEWFLGNKKDILPPVLLLLFFSGIYFRWLNFHLFSSSDYPVELNATFSSGFSWPVWIHNQGLGGVDTVLWRPIFSLWPSMFHLITGSSFFVYDKFFVLWPWIVLSALAPYYFVRYVVGSRIAGVIGALVFGLNTYFLAINTQGHIPLSIACGFGALGILFYLKSMDEPRWLHSLLAVLFLQLCGLFDFRFLYITIFIILGHFILFELRFKELGEKALWRKISHLSVILGLTVALNVYWVIVFFTTGATSEVTGRALFGGQFWSLPDALALHHPFWNGHEPVWFQKVAVPVYDWLIPITATLGLILGRKRAKILFFGVVALVGVLLTKQTDQPFPWLYPFLNAHFPGFGAYREATKFYYPIILGYSVLIGYAGLWTWQWITTSRKNYIFRYAPVIPVVAVLAVLLYNSVPLVSGSIKSMFIPRQVPAEYQQANQFISSQQDTFRVLWLPAASRWASYSESHPSVNAVELSQKDWVSLLTSNAMQTQTNIENQVLSVVNQPNADSLLAQANIRYVIVPIQDDQIEKGFYDDYGKNSQDYIHTLDHTSYLKRVPLPSNRIAIYETKKYLPVLTATDNLTTTSELSSYGAKTNFLRHVGMEYPVLTKDAYSQAGALIQPFEHVATSTVKTGLALNSTSTVHVPQSGAIYQDTANAEVDMQRIGNNLSFFTHFGSRITTDKGRILSASPKDVVFKTVPTSATDRYVASINGGEIELPADSYVRLGSLKDMKSLKLQRIANDATGKVGGTQPCKFINSPAQDFDTVGLFNASHTGCAVRQMNSVPAAHYYLGIEYQGVNSGAASIHIKFNDPAGTMISRQLTTRSYNDWQNVLIDYQVPKDATSTEIDIDTIATAHTDATISFRRGFLGRSSNSYDLTLPPINDKFTSIPYMLGDNESSLQVRADGYTGKNLIADAGFSDGAWTPVVGDCNDYDTHGSVSMGLDRSATDHGISLWLASIRHTACTETVAYFTRGGTYQFSFDGRGTKGASVAYNLQYNDEKHSVDEGALPLQQTDSWQHFSQQLHVPYGATNAILTIYAFEGNGYAQNKVTYDNFNLVSIPDVANDIFVYGAPQQQLEATSLERTTRNTNELYSAQATKVSNTFLLSLAETYNTGWGVYLAKDGAYAKLNNSDVSNLLTNYMQPVSMQGASHLEINGYANGWIIDPAYIKSHYSSDYWQENQDGSISFNLVVYFKPQTYFYEGLIFSGTALVGYLGTLTYLAIRDLVQSKKHKRHVRY